MEFQKFYIKSKKQKPTLTYRKILTFRQDFYFSFRNSPSCVPTTIKLLVYFSKVSLCVRSTFQ